MTATSRGRCKSWFHTIQLPTFLPNSFRSTINFFFLSCSMYLTVATTAQSTPPSCLSLFVTRFSPRHTYVCAPLSVSLCCTHTPSRPVRGRTHAREETRWSSLSAPSWSDFYLAFSLSFFVYCSVFNPGYPYHRPTTKPKFAEHRRTNETTASRTNARLSAHFAVNLLFPRGALAHDRRDIS